MIGDRLRELRIYWAHMNQIDLARASGVSNVTISYIERNERHPRNATIHKLAKGLGVSVEELTGKEDTG
jgi:transcriptional regulator with XRE-family HTH domain